ncbi:MAG: WYL domain-containing protein [Sedimentisphaerales bacterium]|nr:WYL domain-containing protein [Sedimentisphaerales bacterium]
MASGQDLKSDRVRRIMQTLTTLQSGKGYSIKELSRIFGRSKRTIFRDLDQLREIGVPCHYNTKERCYKIGREYLLPPLDLRLKEALSLLLLVYKARNQIQLPFRRSALLAASKIENNLPLKTRQYCKMALSNISTKLNGQTKTDTLDETFTLLSKAIRNHYQVEILYRSLYENRYITTRICPYHIMYNRRAWYVIAFSSIHKSIRTFKLNRIEQTEPLTKYSFKASDFDIDEYLGRA